MASYQNYPVEQFDTLKQMYHTNATRFGNKTLFLKKTDGKYESIDFQRYADEVDALGTALVSMGLAGKPIVIIGGNSYEWTLAYMAAICMGVAVPLGRKTPPEEVKRIALHCQAAAILCSDRAKEDLETVLPSLPRITFSKLKDLIKRGKRLLQAGNRSYLNLPLDPDEMRLLIFTSGTQDNPKGVMLSHRNLCFNLSEMCQMIHIDKEDVFLTLLPLHHIYQCTCGFLCPLYRGATVAFAGSPRHVNESIREVRPTVLLCVPLLIETLYQKIVKNIERQDLGKQVAAAISATNAIPNEKLRLAAKQRVFADVHNSFGGQLRLLISGGATVDPKTLSGLRDFGFLALQGYGLTECSPIVALNRDTCYNDRAAGMGTPNTLLDIYETQEDGTGEIRFYGKNVMLGYYRMPELTQAVIRNGWFYTGDLGYIDKDGFLFITGRKKNMIVTEAGKSVLPEELETLLVNTAPIKEAVVVGYTHPKKKTCDVVAILHPDFEKLKELYPSSLTLDQMEEEIKSAISYVNARVPAHKRISTYLIRSEEFPKNTSNKIRREGIAATYRTAYLSKIKH